ncbi:hypothetical protein H4W33_006475 [Kibdelosporangium phytohabitans]|nr:hypothetical protein [Kibdelosporangium phytohabitans]
MGIEPTRSLIVVIESGQQGMRQIATALRVDIPTADLYLPLALQLRRAVQTNGIPNGSVALIVVDESPGFDLPHRELLRLLGEQMRAINVPITAALWTGSIRTAAPWASYLGPEAGTLPDPALNVVSLGRIATGHRIFRSRDELAAGLSPATDATTVRRRTDMAQRCQRTFSQGAHSQRTEPDAETVEAARAVVNDAIIAAVDGQLPAHDDDIVQLAVALTSYGVRDWCINHVFADSASAAENLWLVLTRESPPGWRADPAVLLAVHAFARGDGVLANTALDIADDEQPEHTLGGLLRLTIDSGMPTTRFLQALRDILPATQRDTRPAVPATQQPAGQIYPPRSG